IRTEFIRAVPAHEPADAQDGDAEDSQGRNNKAFGLEKLLHVCPHSFLLLYKAYTAELTGISTAPLKFGVVVAGQLHPLCDGGVAVAEHSDVKIYITIENIFHPVAHHI